MLVMLYFKNKTDVPFSRFSEKLANLNDILQKLEIEKEKMESDLRLKYGTSFSLTLSILHFNLYFSDAPSLTLRSASGQGMFIHLSRSKRDKKKLDLDPEFYSIGESLSTKSYIYRVIHVSSYLLPDTNNFFNDLLGLVSTWCFNSGNINYHNSSRERGFRTT